MRSKKLTKLSAVMAICLSIPCFGAVISIDKNTSRCEVTGLDNDTLLTHCNDGQDYRMDFAYIRLPLPAQKQAAAAREYIRKNMTGLFISARKMPDKKMYPNRRMYMIYYQGKNVNGALVQLGHAWVDLNQTRSKDFLLRESYAAAEHAGLWAYPNPVHPNVLEAALKKEKKLVGYEKSIHQYAEGFARIQIGDKKNKIAYPATCFEAYKVPGNDQELLATDIKREAKGYKRYEGHCTALNFGGR